jgi:thiamine-phosphate pyrophosphorylase
VLIVNDRVDVALVTGVDGVHLGARSLSVAHARAILGGGGVVGASLHRPEEIGDARAKGADYAFVGTIFPTPTHPGVEGMGADGIARAVAVAGGLPCLGIGGIDVARVRDVVRAGAHGVAVVRGVWLHSRPASAVTEYLAALEDAHV